MKVLDLFSGIGGFSLGLERAGMETVAFCEIDPFCQKVLTQHWPWAPIHQDIKTLQGDEYGPIDVICGGFPCQPFSLTGHKKGKEDDRYLWPEMLRVIAQARPAWVIAENVTGIVGMVLDELLAGLEGEGYTARTLNIPAVAVDAPHRRERIWIIAYSDQSRCGQGSAIEPEGASADSVCERVISNADTIKRNPGPKHSGRQEGRQFNKRRQDSRSVADIESERLQGIGESGEGERKSGASERKRPAGRIGSEGADRSRWPAEPGVGRVVNGLSNRVDRIRGLGNAVVPRIPEIIGRAIMELKNES